MRHQLIKIIFFSKQRSLIFVGSRQKVKIISKDSNYNENDYTLKYYQYVHRNKLVQSYLYIFYYLAFYERILKELQNPGLKWSTFKMPRNHKKNYTGRYNLKYSRENLFFAIAAVKKKEMSLRKAAEQYGVPRTTLKRKVRFMFPNLQLKMI